MLTIRTVAPPSKGLKVGTSKVTARTDDGGFMSSCNVTVGVGVEKIELDKSELSLKKRRVRFP